MLFPLPANFRITQGSIPWFKHLVVQTMMFWKPHASLHNTCISVVFIPPTPYPCPAIRGRNADPVLVREVYRRLLLIPSILVQCRLFLSCLMVARSEYRPSCRTTAMEVVVGLLSSYNVGADRKLSIAHGLASCYSNRSGEIIEMFLMD